MLTDTQPHAMMTPESACPFESTTERLFRPMKASLLRGILLAAMATVTVAPPAQGHPESHSAEPCKCATFKQTNGWCGRCKKGYVASIPVPNYDLFEALDPHGHDYDPASIKCKTCQDAIKTKGFCGRDNMGFLNGLAYVSRLTYTLAKGKAVDPAGLTCTACARHARQHGWCDACKRGMAGNVAFTVRSDFEDAATQIDLLLEAIKTLDRCEICAIALFTGGKCPKCNILYGRHRPASKPTHAPQEESETPRP